MWFLIGLILMTSCRLDYTWAEYDPVEELTALVFLDQYDPLALAAENARYLGEWNFNTNITDYNEQKMNEKEADLAKFNRKWREDALQFDVDSLSEDTARKINFVKEIGVDALSDDKIDQLNGAVSQMSSIYSKAKVCLDINGNNTCMALEPGLTRLMAESRDYDQLLSAWKGWRDQTGKLMKQNYEQFVDLSNEGVRSIGYKDTGDEWRSDYETETFENDVLTLYNQIRPLYEQLHGYVRRKLVQQYGQDKFPKSGHIPAHLLGNMWSQEWNNILDLVTPFPNKTSLDVTPEMHRQNYTVTKMFRTAEDFFMSLGLKPMVPTFWNLSMLERPDDGRDVTCHGSAEDMYDGKDFRIKMCTDVNIEDFMTVHHEMGHIEYFMHYSDLPRVYRDGANPGFHEAVADLMTLSFQTPEHLNKIGLLSEIPHDDESDLNFLMNMALQKLAFLPFGYLIDQWRWSVFRGSTTPDRYNSDWWDMRCRFQGIAPPVARSEDDFDPGAKYHVAANVPYIRYFVSFLVQFQFHKAACDAAGYVGPLHRCDIYNNKDAGTHIANMLKMGRSRPWTEAMQKMTGQEKIDAQPMIDYFQPLYDFLMHENGNDYGWHPNCPSGDGSTVFG